MINEISQYLKGKISNFTEEDSLLFNNKIIRINGNNFSKINGVEENKTIAFIDGGQAEILSAGNFCLSFVRIGCLVFSENKKINDAKKEFYLLTTAKYTEGDLIYESKVFFDDNGVDSNYLIDENDLLISSNNQTIKSGIERAPISKVTNMARRFAELQLASVIDSDFVVLDGTLEATFRNEEKYLKKLNENVCALAKSSSLFTTSGNSPVVLLNKLGFEGCWYYFIDDKCSFVKLHENTKYVFRFMGDKEVLPFLVDNCKDALFLGYPYGLIAVDRFARVSNEEKKSLRMNFLLRAENKELVEYLNTSNAHVILDNLG